MIDEKKIIKAAREHAVDTWNHEEEQFSCMDGFEAGANWALREFKKSLWHDASEDSEPDKLLLLETEVKKKVYYHIHIRSNVIKLREYKGFAEGIGLKRWCYIDDLFPKEGGEE